MNPEIVVFSCNWNGWSCVEAAINAGLKYPPSVKVVRVNCLSRIHAGLVLQALDLGADGVMLLGCEPGKCHFGTNSNCSNEEFEKAQEIMVLLGMEKERLVLLRLSAFDGQKFVSKILKMLEDLKKMLPQVSVEQAAAPSVAPITTQ